MLLLLLCGAGLAADDSDGDGVSDIADRCPGTVAGAPVNVAGCERDEDRDGVVDRLDACPRTEPGAAVTIRGCEPDSDGDGLADRVDDCPNTAEGGPIDARGCAIGNLIRLDGVRFARGSARFEDGAGPVLDAAAATLLRYPRLHAEVAGHTDSNGAEQMNLELSTQRAHAVAAYLVSRGVDASRLTARGYGEDEPIAGNDTAAGRMINRRVELRLRLVD